MPFVECVEAGRSVRAVLSCVYAISVVISFWCAKRHVPTVDVNMRKTAIILRRLMFFYFITEILICPCELA